jgi:hypothetical protein
LVALLEGRSLHDHAEQVRALLARVPAAMTWPPPTT